MHVCGLREGGEERGREERGIEGRWIVYATSIVSFGVMSLDSGGRQWSGVECSGADR